MKYGLIPEFVGRLPALATLEDLDESTLKRILVEPKNALVKQYHRLFEMESIDLSFAEEALGAIAPQAIERKTGARGQRSIMEGTERQLHAAPPARWVSNRWQSGYRPLGSSVVPKSIRAF